LATLAGTPAAIENGVTTVDSIVQAFNTAKGTFKTPHPNTERLLETAQKDVKELQEEASAIVDFTDTSKAIISLRDLLKIAAEVNTITTKSQKAWSSIQKKELDPIDKASGIPYSAFIAVGQALQENGLQGHPSH